MKLVTGGGFPQKPTTCTNELYEIVKKCFQYNPNLRPTFSQIQNLLNDIAPPEKIASSNDGVVTSSTGIIDYYHKSEYHKTPSSEPQNEPSIVYDVV